VVVAQLDPANDDLPNASAIYHLLGWNLSELDRAGRTVVAITGVLKLDRPSVTGRLT
jgi:hypothetical protein